MKSSKKGHSSVIPGQAGVNHALRVERELHALAGGAWDGPGSSAHRTAWALRVRRPCAAECWSGLTVARVGFWV